MIAARARRPGCPVVLRGSETGRDAARPPGSLEDDNDPANRTKGFQRSSVATSRDGAFSQAARSARSRSSARSNSTGGARTTSKALVVEFDAKDVVAESACSEQ